MRRAAHMWLWAICLVSLIAGEWARSAPWPAAAALAVAALASVLLSRGAAGKRETGAAAVVWAGAAVAVLLGAASIAGTRELTRITRRWGLVREELVTRASRRLGGDLEDAVALARSLAGRATAALAAKPVAAFAALDRLTRGAGPSRGIVLFDSVGRPRAWGGVVRVRAAAAGPELSAVTTPFYLWLIARRHTAAGIAVAMVMLARSDEVPKAGVALTDRFGRETDVGLRFLDPRVAAPDSDVFDYVDRAGGGDTLFAVQPVPPAQGDAFAEALAGYRRLVLVGVLLLLVIAVAGAVRLGLHAVAPALPAWAALAVIARAPLKEAFGPGSPFWPDTYYARLLGPFSASAGGLILVSVVLFAVACSLWRRGSALGWARVVSAVAFALLAPYLLQALARGITPPAGGVSPYQWLTWQLALVSAASVVVVVAAGLVRGPEVPVRAGPWPYAAGAIALVAAVAGLWLWQPARAWPPWYPYLWAPALLIAIRPMPFRAVLTTVAVVAGSSAALLTWGATNDGRMALAARDLEALGNRTDPLAVSLLDRLVHELPADTAPHTAGELFVLWRRSALGSLGYPASLAVWDTSGSRTLSLGLAQLDVPAATVEEAAREAWTRRLPTVQPLLRVPGLYGIAALPTADGRVVTVTIGPRSRLVGTTRLADFLLGTSPGVETPYEAALAPPAPGPLVPTAGVAWRREGWQLRGERVVELPGGPRHVHATVDLRGPSALLQRGALVLALDVAMLGALWLALELLAGRAWPALRSWWLRAHRSLRLRLTVSLALFFVVPTVAFAAWSINRLEEEFQGARALLLHRLLRDAGAELSQQGSSDSALAAAAGQVDAELLLWRGGVLAGTTAPVLVDLGLSDLLVPGAVYSALAHRDELEMTLPELAAPQPTLVGYHLLSRSAPGEADILAAPEFLSDRALTRREVDLGVAVLVAGLAGCVAALILSGLAARALAKPIDALRQGALGVGAGEPPAPHAARMPVELEPIHRALEQAAADVEAGQRAQRVLAWGEVARQVAHEIKNPLTPIRLGIQHLLRLGQERPAELGGALEPTGGRILAEIERLDAIARGFSRLSLPAGEGEPLESVDIAAVVRDVLHLYRMGQGAIEWDSDVEEGARACARRDELVEVIVNLCENARDAGARRVVITARSPAHGPAVLEVRDDGHGIAAEVLNRVFEPRFSTTTSGSGLGLAISKRLVEGWGGSIAIGSTDGGGTTVRLELRSGSDPGSKEVDGAAG